MQSNQSHFISLIQELFLTGLNAVRPDTALKRECRIKGNQLSIDESLFSLDHFENIYIVGAGKGTAPMAKSMEEILGERLTGGIIVVKYGHTESLNKVQLIEAAHPVPDEAGVQGAKKIIALAKKAGQNDLVICLISGGGSSLLPLPARDLTLEDKQLTTDVMLSCGANIHEINTIRKHLSEIKGGQLAESVFPATLISLIVSDVIGDKLDVIASGPTVPDSSAFSDCISILEKYNLKTQVPNEVISHLLKGTKGEIQETPKKDNSCFETVMQKIIARNSDALRAIENEARKKGFHTYLLSDSIQGEAKDVAKYITSLAKTGRIKGETIKRPACIISGGETTVCLKGNGKGGRNQEMALAAAIELQDSSEMYFLSCGTDGNDGPTDATGAIVTHKTFAQAKILKLDPIEYLNNNDSYHFFEQIGGLIKTGPTNTNVMDVQILIIP